MPEYGRVRSQSMPTTSSGESDGEADASLVKQLSLTLGRQFSGRSEVFRAEDSTPACLRRRRFQLRDVLLFVFALSPITTLVRPPPIFAPYNGTCPDETNYHHWAAQMDGTDTWLDAFTAPLQMSGLALHAFLHSYEPVVSPWFSRRFTGRLAAAWRCLCCTDNDEASLQLLRGAAPTAAFMLHLALYTALMIAATVRTYCPCDPSPAWRQALSCIVPSHTFGLWTIVQMRKGVLGVCAPVDSPHTNATAFICTFPGPLRTFVGRTTRLIAMGIAVQVYFLLTFLNWAHETLPVVRAARANNATGAEAFASDIVWDYSATCLWLPFLVTWYAVGSGLRSFGGVGSTSVQVLIVSWISLVSLMLWTWASSHMKHGAELFQLPDGTPCDDTCALTNNQTLNALGVVVHTDFYTRNLTVSGTGKIYVSWCVVMLCLALGIRKRKNVNLQMRLPPGK